MTKPAIQLQGINKRFGAVHANKDIDLAVMPGTIHGIVGENGAGKSTLMSILYGFYQADSGTIEMDGKPVTIKDSQNAISQGIGMVHQHFMLVETFTVLENIMLGAEGHGLLNVAMQNVSSALKKIENEYGLKVDSDAIVGELPVGIQQRVEILKALYRGARILILDEPTGVLTPQEIEQFFGILNTLKSQGVTIILITHKLKEIMAITDSVSVMRQGAMVAHRQTAETTVEELAELMVGRKVLLRVDKTEAKPGEERLNVNNVSLYDSRGVKRLKNLNFSLKAGEILGVAGVSGNGQSELLAVLSGTKTPQEGEFTLTTSKGRVSFNAREKRDAALMRQLSVGHIPEDRIKQGLVKPLPAAESAILGFQHDVSYGKGLLDPKAIDAATRDMMEQYDVRPADPTLKSANFSGGNQQKLIIAREMLRQPEVLLVGQPTRGVDIGAIEFIHRNLITARDNGAAILLVSTELEEIMSLSDRIIVLVDGEITGDVIAKEMDERQLGMLMANAAQEEGAA
ncbi:ABC transporter ATP-binding protein [Enterovibrio paralichthyis]|uniref:ABC transporter ATP-binding protein n=1 Tax=Enterovibrio paralichthyis TaxID=2853805 RepID=UPI001C482348|nr:ABC transporter ATP-binding protein [Enterovibrio paralichthyis]MBV7299203.1 ABC transporter ATP-binding protein [Enterovibrio paralichthyis]